MQHDLESPFPLQNAARAMGLGYNSHTISHENQKENHNAPLKTAHDPTDAGLPQIMMIMMMMICAMKGLGRKDKENALMWTQAGGLIYIDVA